MVKLRSLRSWTSRVKRTKLQAKLRKEQNKGVFGTFKKHLICFGGLNFKEQKTSNTLKAIYYFFIIFSDLHSNLKIYNENFSCHFCPHYIVVLINSTSRGVTYTFGYSFNKIVRLFFGKPPFIYHFFAFYAPRKCYEEEMWSPILITYTQLLLSKMFSKPRN